jgi:hypothetical protein
MTLVGFEQPPTRRCCDLVRLVDTEGERRMSEIGAGKGAVSAVIAGKLQPNGDGTNGRCGPHGTPRLPPSSNQFGARSRLQWDIRRPQRRGQPGPPKTSARCQACARFPEFKLRQSRVAGLLSGGEMFGFDRSLVRRYHGDVESSTAGMADHAEKPMFGPMSAMTETYGRPGRWPTR